MAGSIAFSQVPCRLRESREERMGRGWRLATPPLVNAACMAALISFSVLQASSAVAADTLQFNKTKLADAREGYFTLSWNAFPSAAEYQLTTADGHCVYRGPLPKAFVSGLADGTYEYHVSAVDAGGQVLATTATPAVVQVEHWPLRLALALLTCGGIVFLVVVGLIVKGTQQARSQPLPAQPPSAMKPSDVNPSDVNPSALRPSALKPSAVKHSGDPT